MVIDTSVTIAYKCSSCGAFDFFHLSFFKLLNKKVVNFKCRCGCTSLNIKIINDLFFEITSPCIGCGGAHTLRLPRAVFFRNNLTVFNCPVTGLEYLFAGGDENVRQKIDLVEKEFDRLIDLMGYDNYFENTQVMFEALNKVHDIAEKGTLECACGCKDIRLYLLKDSIHLECARCRSKETIPAATNNDLKEIFLKRNIIVGCGVKGINSEIKGLFCK